MCKDVQGAFAFEKHDQDNPMVERDMTTSAEQLVIQDPSSKSHLHQVVLWKVVLHAKLFSCYGNVSHDHTIPSWGVTTHLLDLRCLQRLWASLVPCPL